jgi:hypothetical protein
MKVVIFLLLSVPGSTSDHGMLDSGVGVEHPALIGCSDGCPTLVVTSVLY